MNIGIPKERRPFEYRVGLSPAGADMLCQSGHDVFVEHGAGEGAGFTDQNYLDAGATLVYSTEEAYGRADLVLKVARPLQEEIEWLRPGTILAGFLHLASAREDKIVGLLEKKITSIAFEQIQAPDGSLPVLRPFSQIGGLMAAQISARLLQNNWGGKGILMGGVPGVPPADYALAPPEVAGILGDGRLGFPIDHPVEHPHGETAQPRLVGAIFSRAQAGSTATVWPPQVVEGESPTKFLSACRSRFF